MRVRLVVAAVVTVGCLATAGCVQVASTTDAGADVGPASSSPTPSSVTGAEPDQAQTATGGPVAAAFWAEEAEVRVAAIEYDDLYVPTLGYDLPHDGRPDCAPYTWMADLAHGDLSYDELTLFSTWAFWDKTRLPQHGAELCDGDGEPALDPQALTYLSTAFFDSASPDVKRETWSIWEEGTKPIEGSYQFKTSAAEYRSMTAQLRADLAATGVH